MKPTILKYAIGMAYELKFIQALRVTVMPNTLSSGALTAEPQAEACGIRYIFAVPVSASCGSHPLNSNVRTP